MCGWELGTSFGDWVTETGWLTGSFGYSGNAHVLKAFNDNFGITNNNKWTLALSIFYVGYCAWSPLR